MDLEIGMTLRLTCACWSYDRTSALQTGAISPKDITLDYIALPPEQTFLRQLRDREFDISEMSLSAYISARAKGDDYFLALPIFPSRIFRHSAIYVNPRAGIKTPRIFAESESGRFYQMTAAVWARGLLKDEYGVADTDRRMGRWIWRSRRQRHGERGRPIAGSCCRHKPIRAAAGDNVGERRD